MYVTEELELIETIPTKLQTIRFYENPAKELVMTLDTFVQFKEGKDETEYHKMLTKPALELNPNAKKVLVLGGGDLLVCRDLKRLNLDLDITLVDIDEEVIKLFSTRPRLVELNENVFSKIKIYIADAKEWIKTCIEMYDIIILDFPDGTSEELKTLYTKDFYSTIVSKLEKNGVISIQSHSEVEDNVSKLIKELLGNSKIFKYDMPWLGDGSIILGQNL